MQPVSWLKVLLSMTFFHLFDAPALETAGVAPAPAAAAPPPEVAPSPLAGLLPSPPPPPACAVAPLPPIEDPAAQAFEAAVGSQEVVDTADLAPGMSHALVRFENEVASVHGAIELKSAYRPPAYQQHLQQVWDKWMTLRNNQDPACQPLRAQVQDEFARHHLIETQRPVPFSDHTRGLAFDATVSLPFGARLRRRPVSIDSLARLAGVRRPDILHDPVHFKFTGRLTRG